MRASASVRFYWVCALCACGVLPAADAAAETPARVETGVLALYHDNDTFDGTDRWNTASQQVAYAFRPEADWDDTILPDWLTSPARWIPTLSNGDSQKVVAVAVGQQMFTPVSKTQVPPDTHDRPYAGWLYANLSWIAQNEKARDTLQLSLGVVGPWALAHEAQDWMHDTFGVEKFNGWDYQLPNEPALLLAYERIWRLVRADAGEHFSYDFMPLAGIVVGNVYDYANAGFLARFGWNLPDDYNPQCIRPAGVQTPPLTPDEGDFSLYVFFGAQCRATARNIFLDGSTYRSSPSIPKHWCVGEFQGGAALRYKRVSLIFSQVYRTEEYVGQPCPQWYVSSRLMIAF